MARNRAELLPSGRFAIRWCATGGLMAALAAGCDLPGKPNPADRPVTPDQIVSFELLYPNNCAGCHGADGRLGPAPPLNDPTFLAIVPDAELSRVIREGRDGTPMPAFASGSGGPLTDAQVKALAEGIKSHWKPAATSDEPVPNYLLTKADDDVKSAPGSRQRGAEVFSRACAGCHGANGKGGERIDATGGAINNSAFLALISDQALRRIMITGRPDLGMPTFAEKVGRSSDFQPLNSAEIDDLVALLADWRATRNLVVSADKQ